MSGKKLTPMMEQYIAVKRRHPDCLVFFRLGDFYEMFFEDAVTASRELDLALTTRDRNKPPEERVPMCGVPHHAVQNYVSKLTAKGYKVVICEQMEDPAAAVGLVDRDVTRIVTPGTVLDGESLDEDANNYLCGIAQDSGWVGLAFCDLSTGQTEAMAVRLPDEAARLWSELESRRPREAVLDRAAWDSLRQEVARRLDCRCEPGEQAFFSPARGRELMEKQFARQDGDLDANEGKSAALCAVGGLLHYLYETQRTEKLPHLNVISLRRNRAYMELDRATRRNLELTETIRGRERRGSLLWVMDRCKTPMGRRRLRAWLERPLLSAEKILYRQKGVAALVKDAPLRDALRRTLSEVGDLERLTSRLSCGSAGARELQALATALAPVPRIMAQAQGLKAPICRDLLAQMDALEDFTAQLARAIRADDLPATVREGGIIARGFDPQVDHYQDLVENGGQAVLDLEAAERERTGIKNLKIKYNKVFGYYIEISNAYRGEVPQEYIRRQTITNGERYISPELKALEEEILNARERDAQLEYEIFCKLRAQAVEAAPAIQRDADAIAQLDVLCSLAALAQEERYARPKVDESKALEIVDGRHPVVEKTLSDGLFVPNDTYMDGEKVTLALITGPNMAGKSTYMRQVGLIVLMAQMGSFVPAKRAHIGVVDQVFTRIGASDDLSGGQSTFMVEMMETAYILKEATSRSLLLLDEIGRGTSTYDGVSIARAVLEYCGDTVRARTLFATHYHELANITSLVHGAQNFNIAVQKREDKVVFLRKIVPGGASKSYGVEVAALAGVPDQVVRRAANLLKEIEMRNALRRKKETGYQEIPAHDKLVVQGKYGPEEVEAWIFAAIQNLEATDNARKKGLPVKPGRDRLLPLDPTLVADTYATGLPILDKLSQTDLDNLTPMQALQLVAEFKRAIEEEGWKWDE